MLSMLILLTSLKRVYSLDKFWMHQGVKYDFTADLIGIADKSVREICAVYLCI